MSILSLYEVNVLLHKYCKIYSIDNEKDILRYEYIIDFILKAKQQYPDRYLQVGIPINRNKLAKLLSVSNQKATQIIRNLLAWQVIEKVGLFSKNKSRTFRLNVSIDDSLIGYRNVSVVESRYTSYLFGKQVTLKYQSPLLRSQFEILTKHLTVNNAGLDYLQTKYPSTEMGDVIHWYQAKQQGLTTLRFDFSIVVKAEDIGLLSILAGSMFLERPDPLSRIYTNLTSLKREHRQYIHLNGAPLLMTDIVNSQIVFSVAAISDYLSQVERSAAVEANLLKYRTLAVSGQFYEALAHKAGYELTDHNRSLFKKEFFRQVFFSRIRSKGGDVKKAFRKMYRPIAVLINRMKKEHYADFAVALQRMEAQFMIDEVLAALHSQGIMALTIHDSIVLHNHNDRRVAEMMIKELMFSRYGFAPKMKWE